MRKKFNLDKFVYALVALFLVAVFIIPIFGENLKDFEKQRAKRNIEYKYPVTEKDGWYSSEHCRFNVKEWDNLYLRYSGYTEVSEFLHLVDIHVDTISEYIGVNNLGDNLITFTLDTEGYGSVDGENNIIKYSNYYFLNTIDKASITREVAELVIGNSNSASLTEGLYFYIEQYADKAIRLKSIQQDIICRSKIDMNKENSVMLQYVGQNGDYIRTDEDGEPYLNRQMYALYIFSRSFSRYLIDEYGLDKYLELYFSEDINLQYEKIYNKSLEELRELWIEHVNKRYKEVYGV